MLDELYVFLGGRSREKLTHPRPDGLVLGGVDQWQRDDALPDVLSARLAVGLAVVEQVVGHLEGDSEQVAEAAQAVCHLGRRS